MPRFVLLYHDCPPSYERQSHWDFMLESGDVLRTWALGELPRDWTAVHELTVKTHANCPPLALANLVPALQLKDHRREYLQLEGPLSGDRGSVIRIAAGTYHDELEAPDEWQVRLASEDLPALIRLFRTEADGEQWMLTAEREVPSTEC